jgi:predicted nucleic acid-binding protein
VAVIDASALAKFILREEGWREVSRHLAGDSRSLDLARAETANAVWKHQVLYRRIDPEQSARMIDAIRMMDDVISFEPSAAYLNRAFGIAVLAGITVYDSLYIACAESDTPLITSDRDQAGAAEKLGIGAKFIE